MYWVLLEEEAELDLQYLRQFYSSQSKSLEERFTRALTSNFSTLETFPLAFPVVQVISGVSVRRVLIKGFPKALLYLVLKDKAEVRILRSYDNPKH